ncbi:hypothetical protein ES703_64267 [subsurface metagenome]
MYNKLLILKNIDKSKLFKEPPWIWNTLEVEQPIVGHGFAKGEVLKEYVGKWRWSTIKPSSYSKMVGYFDYYQKKLEQRKKFLDEKIYRIEFKLIYTAIDESKIILEYEDDWNGEGSPRYKRTTWRKAVDFIYEYANEIWNKFQIMIDPPHIQPGPNGSIDIHWMKDDFELLINIHPEDNSFAGFYGDNSSGSFIKGKINLSDRKINNGLILWLINN